MPVLETDAPPAAGSPGMTRDARRAAAANGGAGGGATGSVYIGSGRVLGSEMTDTLGAELCYGVDGKTVLRFMDADYIFAPVGIDDQDEMAIDLERLHPALLGFGMVKPLSKADDITAQDLAAMLCALSGELDVTELTACLNISTVFYSMTKEQRQAFARLMWYSFRRWQPDITLDKVKSFLDYGNMPLLLRLFFKKNIGVLDRFLHRLVELMPVVAIGGLQELIAVQQAANATRPEKIAVYPSPEIPEGASDEEAAAAAIAAATAEEPLETLSE